MENIWGMFGNVGSNVGSSPYDKVFIIVLCHIEGRKSVCGTKTVRDAAVKAQIVCS